MARGLLISYSGYPATVTSLFPDNGLASLAGVLLDYGHEVKILDYNTTTFLKRSIPPGATGDLCALLPALSGTPDPEVIERLLAINRSFEAALEQAAATLVEELAAEIEIQGSDFIGFKLWSGDGFAASVRIARALRGRYPELKIFAGGPTVLVSEEYAFGGPGTFDALVDGEGELAIQGLALFAEGKQDLNDVPNLILREGSGFVRTERRLVPELDALPKPVYDPAIYPSLAGDEKIKLFNIDESRGCPMQCAFCIHQVASGNRWRLKSPERVYEEIKAIGVNHGVSHFRLGGSYTPAQFYEELTSLLAAEEASVGFCGFAHPDGLPRDVDELAAVGCKSLFMGIESFVSEDLIRMGKRGRTDRAKQGIRRCMDAGIVPILSLIIPSPGQTDEARELNLQAVLELGEIGPLVVATQFSCLLPRTPWWDQRRSGSFELQVSDEEYRQCLAFFKIRHVIPPSYWEPLPYRLDGRDFAGYTALNSRFQNQLVGAGLVVNIADDIVLLADAMEVSLTEIRDRLKVLCFSLDATGMEDFAIEANRSL